MIPYIKIVQQYELLGVFWLGKVRRIEAAGLAGAAVAVPQDAHR